MSEAQAVSVGRPSKPAFDRSLTIAVWLLVAAVIGFAGYFGYTVYTNRQRALEADASYRLIAALKRQVRQSPNSSVLRVRLGEALASAGRYPDAVEQFNAAIKIEPKHIGAFLDLAQVAMINEDYVKAERYYQKVIEFTEGAKFGNIDERREVAFFHLGELKLINKEYEAAAGFFKQSLRMRGDASDTYLKLAEALIGLGDKESAVKNLEIALTFDPNFAQAHYTLGKLQKESGDDVNASYHFQRAAELAPDVEMAQDALSSFGPPEAWLERSKKALAAGDIEEALDLALVARNLEPTSFVAVVHHGDVLVKRGSNKDAYEVYLQARELKENDAALNAKIAKLRAQLLGRKK